MMLVWHDRPNEINLTAQNAKSVFRRADLLHLYGCKYAWLRIFECVTSLIILFPLQSLYALSLPRPE